MVDWVHERYIATNLFVSMELDAEQLFPDKQITNLSKYFLSIVIHGTDLLKPNIRLTHPLCKVHIVDKSTGQYIKKSNPSKAITKTEQESRRISDHIPPLYSKTFNLRGPGVKYAAEWEEEFEILENYTSFLKQNVLLLFEILNPVAHQDSTGSLSYYRIAWAFLAMVGSNKRANSEKKVRLQLWKYPKNPPLAMTSEDIPYVYHCWAHLKRTKYRSTMYVTAKGKRRTGISKDQQLSATQQQTLSPSLGASQKITANSQKVVSLMCRLEAGPRGCFTCKFSHSGKYLCCGCADWVMFPLKVFDVITGECIIAYSGHHDLIYEINWTLDDSQLLTASSDGTAKLWHFMNGNQTTDSYLTLQHTSFVYCAKFHPVEQLRVVVTGAFDSVIRFWNQDHGSLLYELKTNQSNINCLEFDKSGTKMFTGDGSGIIKVWTGNLESGAFKYELISTVLQFKGSPINCLQLHPTGRLLLVHVRHSCIYSLDPRFLQIRKEYHGLLNKEWPLKGEYNPQGYLLASGSEDSKLYMWEEETGSIKFCIPDLGLAEPISCFTWHPDGLIFAVCAFGIHQRVLIYSLTLDEVDKVKMKSNAIFSSSFKPSSSQSLRNTLLGDSVRTGKSTVEKLSMLAAIPSPPPVATTITASPLMSRSSTPKTSQRNQNQFEITYGPDQSRRNRSTMDTRKTGLWSEITASPKPTDSISAEEKERMRQHRYRVMRREALLTRLQNFTPGTLTGEKDEDTLAVLQRKSLRSKSHRANTPQREADYREDESSSQ